MATFVFELLADGQQLTFDPANDVLVFESAGIDAGDLLVQRQSRLSTQ